MSKFLAAKICHKTIFIVSLTSLFNLSTSTAGINPHIGDIMMTAATFCPQGWAETNGQEMKESENTVLYSLFGTTYGGTGSYDFKLPDLRNRIPIGQGDGPGLSPIEWGQKGGSYKIAVNANNLAGHSHVATTTSTFHAHSSIGTVSTPSDHLVADDDGDNVYITNVTPDITMSEQAVVSLTTVAESSGENATIDSQQPYTTIRYCIAVVGMYPTQP